MPELLILLMVLLQAALPVYLAYALWRAQDETRSIWWLKAAYSSAYVIFFCVTGRWDFISFYLRHAVIALFLVAVIVGYTRARRRPWSVDGRRGARLSIASGLVTLVAFVGLIALAARGYGYSDEPVRLAFPLRDGFYYVAQGGNSPLVNYHNENQAQQYAMDVVQLNVAAARASGLYPSDLEQYVIFNTAVHAPCDGTIVDAIDGFSDNVPPQSDRQHPAGNHVVIGCRGVRVVLAHLRQRTVTVRPGDSVASNDVLGKVGNSGNTSEPHLHVHAVRGEADVMTGEGVPILFDGAFLVRNAVLHR